MLRNPDGINKFVPRNGYTQYYYEDHYQGFDGNFEVGGFWRARTFLVTHWDFVRFT